VLDVMPSCDLSQVTASTALCDRSELLDGFLPRAPFNALPIRGSLCRPALLPGTLESWQALQQINRE